MELRYQKEAKFHNDAYTEGLRAGVSKFYSIIDSSRDFYRQHLISHCMNRQVLEYGCGQNSYAPFLAREGAAEVTGIDISEVAVQQSLEKAQQERTRAVTYRVMNAERLEFPNESFDLICGVAILHHLDLRNAYSEIARTLKPGGTAIFLEPLAHNPLINLYRRLTPKLRTEDEHPLSMQDLKMAESYFGKMDNKYYHLSSLMSVPFSGFSVFDKLLRILESVDETLFQYVPFLRRYAWSVAIVFSQPQKATESLHSGIAVP